MKQSFVPGNYALVVRRSSAGLGLYTKEPIKKGSCIIEYTGRVLTEEEEYTSKSRYLFSITKNKTIDGWGKEGSKAKYINHSCVPNCEPEIHKGRVFIIAKRNIKEGEELSYDYGKEYVDEHIKPRGCRCSKHLKSAAS